MKKIMVFLTMMVMTAATVSARPKMYSERRTQIEYKEAYYKYSHVYEKYEKARDAYLKAYDKYAKSHKKYKEYLLVYKAFPNYPPIARKMSIYSKSYEFCKNDLIRKDFALNKASEKLKKAKQVFDEKCKELGINKD